MNIDDLNVKGGVCLVVGCHPCWQEDYQAAIAKFPDAKICAVNFAGALVDGDYLATSHGECIDEYLQNAKGNPIPVVQASSKAVSGYILSIRCGGTSGNFAALAMALIGFDLVVMCGAPINGDGRYDKSLAWVEAKYGTHWLSAEHKRAGKWQNAITETASEYPWLACKIRSMSGATKRIYGGIE
jgi:hypothetical protein